MIAGTVSKGAYNTISSAYAILAMEAYGEAVGDKAVADITIREVLDGQTRDLALPKGLFPKVAFTDKAKKVRIESRSDYPTFYQVTQAGFDKAVPDKELKEGLEVQREYRDLSGSVITKTTIGSEIEVHVKMRSLKSWSSSNVAIVDLLPGGFEVVLEKSRPAAAPVQPQAQAVPERTHEREEEGDVSEGEEGEGREAEYDDHHDEEAVNAAPQWVSPIGTDASTWQPDFVDIREDRVVLFGTVGPKAREFVYRIKATNKGTYVVPALYGESMYDRTIRARALPGKITVEGTEEKK
jgi:uncharacterized protein YfaS (alpha-2-macroglobulin family)